MKKHIRLTLIIILGLLNAASVSAQTIDEELDILRADLLRLEDRVDSQSISVGFQKLTISGEIRIREEIKKNIYPGAMESLDYLRMRTRLRFDIDVLDNLGAVIELQDARMLGGPTVTDDSGVGLKRAKITIKDMLTEGLTADMGRFVLIYGDQRLIGHLEWFDMGRTYDGFRLSYKKKGWFADLFGVRLDDNQVADDNDDDLTGIYMGIQEEDSKPGLEGYMMLRRNQGVNNAVKNTAESRYVTYGCRIFKKQSAFDYTGELAFQRGEINNQDLRAHAFAVTGGYTLKDCPGVPRFGIEVDYARGDKRTTDNENNQFQTMFPTNHLYYGYADLLGWSNMWNYSTSVSMKPADNITTRVAWHHLQLDDSDDDWLNAGGALLRNGAANASRHIGEEFDFTVSWIPWKPLSLLVGWSHFIPGGFVKDTGKNRDHDLLYFQTRLRF